MKTISWIFGLCLVLAIAGSAASYFTPYPRIWVQTCGLNLGLIQPKDADWGFLKLRSGQAGLDALRDLERHGATDKIRQVSVAVQEQWLEAGHVTHQFMLGDTVPKAETRFSELRMPLDGKTVRQDLTPSQHIPETFWQTQRFRLPCIHPPKWASVSACGLRMADLTGDGQAEILFERRPVGTLNYYNHSVIIDSLTIYQSDKKDWQSVKLVNFCAVDQAITPDAHLEISTQRPDILWLGDHAVNFFEANCDHDNSTSGPAKNLAQAQGMATHIKQIPILSSSKTLPLSLISALKNHDIILTLDGEPSSRYGPKETYFNAMPPCFIAHDPKTCAAVIADIDHDGSDDVVIIDRDVTPDHLKYRLATLLSLKQGRWTIINSQAVCAEYSEKLEDMKITLKPSAWKPMEFAGRLYLPSEDNDSCTHHYMIL